MTKFIIRRFLWMLVVLFAVSLITFTLMNSIPGGPFDSAGERELPPEIVANIEAKYGLNDPIWFRYVGYIGDVAIPKLTYGEFQYNLTLDREDAGLEPITDENGDPAKLSVPRNVLSSFNEKSVIDNYLINIPMPFIRKNVPVNVRDAASGGGNVVAKLDPGTPVEVLRINNAETYYEVRVPDETFGEGDEATDTGWVLTERVDVDAESVTPEDPVEATLAPSTTTLRWLNFGPSYASRSLSVNDLYRNQLVVSVILGLAALSIALVIGVPLGVVAALSRNTSLDYFSMGVAILGVSVPVIVLGPVLRLTAVQVPWMPVSGWGTWQQAVLPAFALGFSQSALIARLTRASLLQVLNEDYIRTARAKGLEPPGGNYHPRDEERADSGGDRDWAGVRRLITGSLVAETIFAIPGLGRYFVTSVTNRDYPVIMGTILVFAFMIVIANMLVDVIYALLDPRIRYD